MKLPDLAGIGASIAAAKTTIIGVLAAIAVCLPLGFIKGCDYGVAKEQAEQAERERAARLLADESAGSAALEREGDRQETDTQQQERDNAIRNATGDDDVPSPASNALTCERLRQQGTDVSQLPACGGRPTGTEAGDTR